MADRVLVRAEAKTPGVAVGTEVWMDETEQVRGMVDGGYWSIVDRRAVTRGTAKTKADGVDQA